MSGGSGRVDAAAAARRPAVVERVVVDSVYGRGVARLAGALWPVANGLNIPPAGRVL